MFEFAETEVPAVTRNTAPNPFMDAVRKLLTEDGKPSPKALTFAVDDVPDSRKVKAAQRQLRECGKPLNVTVRQTAKQDGKRTVITFWTVERITHSDAGTNGTETPAETPAPEKAAEKAPETAKAPAAKKATAAK